MSELNPYINAMATIKPNKKVNLIGGFSSKSNIDMNRRSNSVMKKPFTNFNAADYEMLVKSRNEYDIRRLVDKVFKASDLDNNGILSYGEVKEMC